LKRVLGPRGRVLSTYFLLNDDSREFLLGDDINLPFRPVDDRHSVTRQQCPEEAVAYNENWLRNLYSHYGFHISHIGYGDWCRRSNEVNYQDFILASV